MKSFFLLLLILMNFSFAANEGGHGGDVYANEFRALGNSLSQKLIEQEKLTPNIFTKWKFKADDFREAVEKVRVVSADGSEMILKGEEVDAINFPEQKKIKVNRNRWRENDLNGRLILVMHEYFGILKVELDRYDATQDFISLINDLVVEGPTIGNALVQYFYGRCVVNPPLNQIETCMESSPELQKAIVCAFNKAKSKCDSEKNNCREIETSFEAKLSRTQMGARFCEVISVFK